MKKLNPNQIFPRITYEKNKNRGIHDVEKVSQNPNHLRITV